MTEIPPAFILPLLSPLSTTPRYPFSSAQVPTCFGETPTSDGRSQVI
jgi:hypothetical protein